jgi:hypothetical protein
MSIFCNPKLLCKPVVTGPKVRNDSKKNRRETGLGKFREHAAGARPSAARERCQPKASGRKDWKRNPVVFQTVVRKTGVGLFPGSVGSVKNREWVFPPVVMCQNEHLLGLLPCPKTRKMIPLSTSSIELQTFN